MRDNLPNIKVSVDHFHVIQRAILMIMQVRRRNSHEVHERRGRAADPAYKYRQLLKAADTHEFQIQMGGAGEIPDKNKMVEMKSMYRTFAA